MFTLNGNEFLNRFVTMQFNFFFRVVKSRGPAHESVGPLDTRKVGVDITLFLKTKVDTLMITHEAPYTITKFSTC